MEWFDAQEKHAEAFKFVKFDVEDDMGAHHDVTTHSDLDLEGKDNNNDNNKHREKIIWSVTLSCTQVNEAIFLSTVTVIVLHRCPNCRSRSLRLLHW